MRPDPGSLARRLLLTSVLTAATFQPAFGQTNDEAAQPMLEDVTDAPAIEAFGEADDAIRLSPVVVTATGAPVDLRDAPASISVITREDIERQPTNDLATVLRRIPGVTGGYGPEGEASKIKLRGLPDQYTLILVDGKRVGSSADTNYRRDLGRQDLNWITPDLIERIEVVRGPMSSLYGSDAMGGVINIITRKTGGSWAGSVTSNYTLAEDSDRGDAYQLGFSGSGPLTDTLGLRLSGSVSQQDPDETDELGAGGFENQNIDAQLNWDFTPSQNLALDLGYGKQRAESSSKTDEEGEPLQDAWGATKLERRSIGLTHEGDWGFGRSTLAIYQNEFKNEIDDGKSDSTEQFIDGSFNLPVDFLFPQAITIGGQWKREKLTNTQTIGTVPVDYEGNPVSGATVDGDTSALFIEDEIYLLDNLSLTLGLRGDFHDEYGSHASPRAYLVYHPLPEWTLRGGVARGFRAPSLTESTAGAATFSRGFGCTSLIPLGYVSGGCYMAGNPDLEPETSTNYEVGVGYHNDDGWDLGLTYFHTDFKNKIDYAPLGFFNGQWWTQMQNAEKARTQGLEGSAVVPVVDSLIWRTNFTYMIEAKNLTTGADLLSTPEWSVWSALDWQATETISAEFSADYASKQLGGGDTFAKAYVLFNLTGAYQLNENLTLRAGVLNIANEDTADNGSTDFYVPGRRYFAGLTARF